MLLADGCIETIVDIGIPVAVHVVGLPSADARGTIVTITHGKGVLNDRVAERIPMTVLFTVGVSPLVTERKPVVNSIVQTVITQTDVQRVGIVAHIHKVLQVGCRARGDVLEMQFLGMPRLFIDGSILDKAVPDVDGHRVASDEGVNAATLVV